MVTVLDCINRIPSKLIDIKNNRNNMLTQLKNYLQEETIRKIIFVASGSSYNAVHTTRSFFEKLGFEVQYIYPNLFLNYSERLDSEALYVVVSQGGSTKLVFDSLKKIKEGGCKNLSITGDLSSPIANESDISIDMGCGYEEFMYRTLGFSTTVATSFQLAMALASINHLISEQFLEELDQDYFEMISNLEKVRDISFSWYEKHRFTLMKKNIMIFSGTNDLWPISNECDIKFMEMVPMMTRSFELEEFIHGPQNAFNDSMAFFILGKQGEDEEKVKSIAQFLKNEIGFCSVVGNIGTDDRDLFFNVKSKNFSALEFVTTAQVIAYKLSIDFGRDLSRPVNGQIKNYITKTL